MARLLYPLTILLAASGYCWGFSDLGNPRSAQRGWAQFAAGVHAELRDDNATALEYYRRAASHLSDSAQVSARLGFMELVRNNPQEAQRYLARATDLSPADSELKAITARSFELAGDPAQGTRYLEEVIRANPLSARGYESLARMYIKAGMWAGAVSAYVRLSKLPGYEALAYGRLSDTYINMAGEHFLAGNTNVHLHALRKALHWLDRTEKIRPGLSSIMQKRARCYAGMLRFRKAADEYRKYLNVNPNDTSARRYLALVQRSGGRIDEAVATLQQILDRTPEFLEVRLELIDTLMDGGHLKRAAEIAETTAARFPDNLIVLSLAGRCLLAVDRDEEAGKHLQRALELDPRINRRDIPLEPDTRQALIEATLHLGLIHIRAGNDKTAMHFFGMTLELDPEDAEANNNLGYLTLEAGGDARNALQLILRAVRIRPTCGEFLDSLGWVYFKLDRTEEAYEMLKDAADLVRSAEIHDHLGQVYRALGRETEARQEWMRSLELDPEYHPARLHLENSYTDPRGK